MTGLYGLQIDRYDVSWGTMLAANKLFRFDIRSEQAQLFDLPQANSGPRRQGSTRYPIEGEFSVLRFEAAHPLLGRGIIVEPESSLGIELDTVRIQKVWIAPATDHGDGEEES